MLQKVSKITPVPGGVGPMTITMLLNNLVVGWMRQNFDLMINLQLVDYNKFGLTLAQRDRIKETHDRPCHLSLTQNEEFARYIHEHFLKKCNIHEILKRPEEHFTPSATLEEAGLKVH